ncbi:MAG: hypothetical protein KDA72_19930, partial [Planctomycetales bacterium]|nr:hypothetical protein [Planctomycetales bacterium]
MLKLAGQQIVEITAKNAVGYEVGAVAAGERLVFRYRGGKGKGWGRFATESPDSEMTERKDHCRLAIGFIKEDGNFKRLAVVPANTATTPFQWV